MEIVGIGCYTSEKWNRNICQATRVEMGTGIRFYKHGKDPIVYRKGATFLADKISSLLGEDKFLQTWRKNFTKQLGGDEVQFNNWLQSTADFGTISHILYDEYQKGNLSTEILEGLIKDFAKDYKLGELAVMLATETAKKNVLAFRQFDIDHQTEVYAIEQMVTSGDIGISTPVDVLGKGMFSSSKGKKKEKCWFLGNLKSSESAQDHKWQCAVEYYCASRSIFSGFDEMLPVVVGTIRPKDFKNEPTFEWKDYTDFATSEYAIKTIEAVAEILKNTANPPNIRETKWDGILQLNTPFDSIPLF